MSGKVQLPETTTHELIYESSLGFKFKLFLLTIIVFSVSLFFFFPVEENLEKLVTSAIKSNRSCPLTYKKMDISLFFPKIKLKDVNLPPRCLGKRSGAPINLDHVQVTLTVPTLFPPGIKSSVQVKKGRSVINAYPRISVNEQVIRVTRSSLTGEFISSFTNFPKLLKGTIQMEGLFNIAKNKLQSGDFKIDSNNLKIPAQNLSGFDIMTLDLKKLALAGNIKKNDLNLKALKIGSKSSPLQAEFKGKIDLVPTNINFSKMALNGKVKFSSDLKKSLPILDLFLGGKKKVKGFYPMSLGGTFAAPKPNFLK